MKVILLILAYLIQELIAATLPITKWFLQKIEFQLDAEELKLYRLRYGMIGWLVLFLVGSTIVATVMNLYGCFVPDWLLAISILGGWLILSTAVCVLWMAIPDFIQFIKSLTTDGIDIQD